jgi:hypothetical protein
MYRPVFIESIHASREYIFPALSLTGKSISGTTRDVAVCAPAASKKNNTNRNIHLIRHHFD